MKLIVLVAALVLSACFHLPEPPQCSPPPCSGTLVCYDDACCVSECIPDP